MADNDKAALYRNFILVLVLASVALIVHNIFGQNGYLALRQRQKELMELQQKILQLKQENELLDKENRELKTNPDAIERRAREQMHLIKPGERVYILPDKTSPTPPSPAGKEDSLHP